MLKMSGGFKMMDNIQSICQFVLKPIIEKFDFKSGDNGLMFRKSKR